VKLKRILAVLGIAALTAGMAVLLFGSSANASHSLQASTDKPLLWGCVNPSTHALVGGRFYVYDGTNTYPGCSSWATRVNWAEGNGAPGVDSAVAETSTAQTSIINWPESSGWAVDNMTRTVTVTRQNPVDAGNCGGSAAQCYFYTASLVDSGGTFTTVSGHAAPNTGLGGAIDNAYNGTFQGGGKVEFYASSNKPDGSLVTTHQDGHGLFSTTDWVKQFFPNGTYFGSINISTYLWQYTLGCHTQTWNDGIKPGDDGQGTSDGNITTSCTP